MEKTKKILDAALRLFVEYGFHGTPTSRIAEKAGVANGTLFNKFATKNELIIALFIDIESRMSQYVFENAKQENTYKDTFKGMYFATLYWALDNNTEFRFIQQVKTSPFVSLIAPEKLKKPISPFGHCLTRASAKRSLNPCRLITW